MRQNNALTHVARNMSSYTQLDGSDKLLTLLKPRGLELWPTQSKPITSRWDHHDKGLFEPRFQSLLNPQDPMPVEGTGEGQTASLSMSRRRAIGGLTFSKGRSG
ncbi:hypothetical protein LA080_010961 [Diaporthe eres]|nr:hypothetical protein LA080_010961 [Diaporthe eres]